jgi:tyrosyl-tRNA synthetase
MTVITDKKKIEELLTRRVSEVVVDESLRKKLSSGRKLRVKLGVDPTAPDLHLGHTVPLKKLREFQELGHQIVLIIGDYTAKVGDPSGKSKTRPMLTDKEVKANAETYMAQAGKVLDLKKIEVRWNSEWFSKMDFNGLLALAAQFTVARMIERDDFDKRLKEGADIHMHELLYPMMQAYDSIMVEADIEIGGTDQRFNILAGRDLQRKMAKPEQDCVFLGPILVGTDGTKKMSKSLGNYIGISEAPEEMYGKTMSIPDAALWDYYALTTDVPADDIEKMKRDCAAGKMNPRDAKAALAKELVTMYHSAKAADAAEEHFRSVFQKKEVPDDVKTIKIKVSDTVGVTDSVEMTVEGPSINVLVDAKLVASNGEARRVIAEGGIRVDGVVVKDVAFKVRLSKKETLIQKGKRHFVKVKI